MTRARFAHSEIHGYNAYLAASRGLSQPVTSFFGFQRQGIHRVPFATCRDDARARYRVLKVLLHHRCAPTAAQNIALTGVVRGDGTAPTRRGGLLKVRKSATFKAVQRARRASLPLAAGHNRKAIPPAGSVRMCAE